MNTMIFFYLSFGVLTASMLLALFFGRLFCSEHRLTLPGWVASALLAGVGWVVGNEQWYWGASAIAAMSLLINGYLHSKALAKP